FDAARAFAYQCKYETFTEDADSRSCIPGWHERFLEIISAELKRSIALPILVIGAGVGDEAKRIWRQFGTDTLLSDVSDGLVENCMRQAPYADLRVGVAEDLSDIRSQSIGSYIALRTLESMFLDKMATLKEAYRVLKVGGMIAISISCAYNENGILQKGRFVSANERDLAGGSEEVLDILRNMESVGLCPLRIYDLETEWLIIGERPRRPSSS
ncbi:MAG: methyltransferase domain-containing protein, partial [Candidatus Thiodiazotropha sp.]